MPQSRPDPRDGCAFQLLLGLQLLVPGVAFLGLRRFRTATVWLVLGVLGWLVFLGWLVGALAIIDATTSNDRRRRRPSAFLQAIGVLVPGTSHLATKLWPRGIGLLMIAALAIAFGALRSGDGVALHDNTSGWTLVVDGQMSVLEEPQPGATPDAVMLTDVHRYVLEDVDAPLDIPTDRPLVLETSLGTRWVIQARERLVLEVDHDARTAHLANAVAGTDEPQQPVGYAALGLVLVIGLLGLWDLRGATRSNGAEPNESTDGSEPGDGRDTPGDDDEDAEAGDVSAARSDGSDDDEDAGDDRHVPVEENGDGVWDNLADDDGPTDDGSATTAPRDRDDHST